MTWLLTLLFACGGKAGDSANNAPPINEGGDTATCEGTAPVIEELVIGNGGIYEFDDGPAPTVSVMATITDEDADLNIVSLTVWYDEAVDGAVDTSGEGLASSPYEMDEELCVTPEANYGLNIQVGGSLDYDTLYEFAAVAKDGNGLSSAVAIASGYTPNEDGTDGGGGADTGDTAE